MDYSFSTLNYLLFPMDHLLSFDVSLTIPKNIRKMIYTAFSPITAYIRRYSPVESPILLRREIPMAWGTTTDSLTPEINPFQYEIEIKYLTLKDQTSYLIPDS